MEYRGQGKRAGAPDHGSAKGPELVIPNPKLKLLDQVWEGVRVKPYAIRTEQAC